MAALNGVQSRKVLVDVTHLVPFLQHSQHELQQHKAGMQGTSMAATPNVSHEACRRGRYLLSLTTVAKGKICGSCWHHRLHLFAAGMTNATVLACNRVPSYTRGHDPVPSGDW